MKWKLMVRALTRSLSLRRCRCLVCFFHRFVYRYFFFVFRIQFVLFDNTFCLNHVGSSNMNDANNLVKQFNYKWLDWMERNKLRWNQWTLKQKFAIGCANDWNINPDDKHVNNIDNYLIRNLVHILVACVVMSYFKWVRHFCHWRNEFTQTQSINMHAHAYR